MDTCRLSPTAHATFGMASMNNSLSSRTRIETLTMQQCCVAFARVANYPFLHCMFIVPIHVLKIPAHRFLQMTKYGIRYNDLSRIDQLINLTTPISTPDQTMACALVSIRHSSSQAGIHDSLSRHILLPHHSPDWKNQLMMCRIV